MKAYAVFDKDGWPPYSEVVFAETRSKAISTALHNTDLSLEGCDYIDLRARRKPMLDKYYRGRSAMDWDNDDDRLAMVRDAGYVCDDDFFDPDECAKCAGKDYCSKYEEYQDEERDFIQAPESL